MSETTTQTLELQAAEIVKNFPADQARRIALLIQNAVGDEIIAKRYLVTSMLGSQREVQAVSADEASTYAEGYWTDWKTASVRVMGPKESASLF